MIALGAAQILSANTGLGTHMWLLRFPDALVPFLRVSLARRETDTMNTCTLRRRSPLSHPATQRPFADPASTQNFWFCLVFYNTALLFIKLTLLFQYYRVVAQVRKFRIVYIIFMFLIGGWTISQIFVTIFSCVPVQRFWDPAVKGSCSNNAAEQALNSIGNIITDFIVLVLPLPGIMRLQWERPQKLALLGIFCLGFL